LIKDKKKYDVIREKFNDETAKCSLKKNELKKDSIETETENVIKNLDLIQLMKSIKQKDQEYRYDLDTYNSNINKQKKNDKENIISIDSLYRIHEKYIGNSLVGEDLGHVMWLVIQHSDIKTMEKFLPIMHQAFLNQDLSINCLKMTIDRVFSLKYEYQIFGSQFGVDIIDENRINEIALRFILSLSGMFK
jgi:hypothetical protein